MDEATPTHMSEPNSLIGPCKKLKLGSSDDKAESATTHVTQHATVKSKNETEVLHSQVESDNIRGRCEHTLDMENNGNAIGSLDNHVKSVDIENELGSSVLDSSNSSIGNETYFTTPLGTVYCMTGFNLKTVPLDPSISDSKETENDMRNMPEDNCDEDENVNSEIAETCVTKSIKEEINNENILNACSNISSSVPGKCENTSRAVGTDFCNGSDAVTVDSESALTTNKSDSEKLCNSESVKYDCFVRCPNTTEEIANSSEIDQDNTNMNQEEGDTLQTDVFLDLTAKILNENDGSDSELELDIEDDKDGEIIDKAPLVTDLDATLTDNKAETADDICEVNEGEVKCVELETDSMNITNIGGKCNSEPLCTSTPMVKYYLRTMQDDFGKLGDDHDDNKKQYESFTTFKPQTVRSEMLVSKSESVTSNSVPLCTSTPMVKLSQGLKMRDMNIMRDGGKGDGKKDITNLQDGLSTLEDSNEKVNYNSKTVNANNEINLRDKKNKSDHSLRNGTIRRDRESKREKRKMKGTRVEKFKEYMGPGLTSNINAENDINNDPNKKDFVKNTDIETCTLTEYKGFGLTGPLPDKPIMTSTPAPPKGLSVRNPNVMFNDTATLKHIEKMTCPSIIKDSRTSLTSNTGTFPRSMSRCISGISLGQRPSGTEGMILSNFGNSGQGHNSHPSATGSLKRVSGFNKCNSGQLSRQTVPMAHRQSLGSHVVQPTLGQLTAQSITDHLATLSGQCSSGTSSTLQPDEVYPSVTSNSSKGDKSDNTSNTDKSDKSEKFFDPKVLQCLGQLKVSAYMNFGLLTVHVVQGRQLATKWKSTCDSFVKMCLIPDDGKKAKCKTEVVQDSNNPLYDEKFSFELNDEDHSKRLMITVWHRDQNASVNEFLGCMSFGVRHLTNPKKEVSGWYYLLTEDIGRKKHLQVSHKQRPQLKARNHSNIPSVNKDVWGTESLQLSLRRGKNGFGFSVVEACPVRVGRVDGASPAEAAGLQPGDIIIRLNKQNVSRSTATSVAKLVKHSSNTLLVEVQRPRPVTFEHLENSPWKSNNTQSVAGGNHTTDSHDDYTVPQMFTLHDDMKENEISVDEDTMFSINNNLASLATSTPLPLLARGHRTVQTKEMRKQESIHRLLSLELDFIDLMHSGMQRYSRPLRHCILSHSQHTALFQNIEKLTTISEYHIKQMHDNAPSSFVSEDTDTSASSDSHNFVVSIGLIYQSKVHMLCQAYDLYAKGVGAANQVLSDLRRSDDFTKFVEDPPLGGNQPSISTFIYRPVQHIRDLHRVLQEIFLNTTQDSPDFNCLKQVVEGLQECANNITNYSCERVESMSSLTSRDSKTSYTSSMKSRSSTSSSRSCSSKGQGHCSGPSCSLQSSKSVDTEVMKIQDRLVFSSNVPVFQLCQDDRHIIFSGDMFKWEGHQWVKIYVILFTDILLQTVKESDGYLRVLHEPTVLRDVVGMDAQRQHGTEFVLHCGNPRMHSSGRHATRKLSLRAPSTEQKYAWKSLVEQRVFAVRGSLEYYSSNSDVSSGSASAIII